jgi:hypothetical protein
MRIKTSNYITFMAVRKATPQPGIERVSQNDTYQRICFIQPSLELWKLMLLFLYEQKHKQTIRYLACVKPATRLQNMNPEKPNFPSPSSDLN